MCYIKFSTFYLLIKVNELVKVFIARKENKNIYFKDLKKIEKYNLKNLKISNMLIIFLSKKMKSESMKDFMHFEPTKV